MFSQACASLEPNYQPPVTFVVVQKRHHTRLFANNHKDRSSTDKSGNILPGNFFPALLTCTWNHTSGYIGRRRFCRHGG